MKDMSFASFARIFFNLLDNQAAIPLLLVLILSLYYLLLVKKKFKLPPGPIGLPFFGYWPFLIKDPHLTLNQLSKKYGNVYGLYLGKRYAVVCNNYEAVREALSKPESLNRPSTVFNLVPFGLGFTTTNGQEWTIQRRFSVKAMRDIGLGKHQWEELIQDELGEVLNVFQSSQGQPIDVREALAGCFANNAMSMLFGHRRPNSDPEVKRFSENINTVMEESRSLDLSNFMPTLSTFLFKIGVWGSKEAVNRINEFSAYVQKCIKEKLEVKELFDRESFVQSYFDEIEQNKKKNLNKNFTDRFLLGNTQTLIIGASETTEGTFLWLLMSMADHPEKQLKVHQELDWVLGKTGTLKFAERAKVPYTFATIMESMRWRTLVPINTLREFSEDTTLQGYDIPKGTIIVSNLWALHNDPRYWKNPEKFEPERFLREDGKSINSQNDSYVPFSFGRRNCPGEMVALTELFLYFTTFMQKFTVLPEEGDTRVKFELHYGITYQAMGVKLRFLAR